MNIIWKVSRYVQLTAVIIASFYSLQAAGEVDTTFNVSLTKLHNGFVSSSLIQPDGKLVIVGMFRTAEGKARTGVARYNANGTLDTGFNPPDIFSAWGYIAVNNDVAIQSTGKIIVVGDILGFNGITNSQRIIRLNADGTLDATFAPPAVSTIPTDVVVSPDDKILIGLTNGGPLALNADGTVDNTRAFPSFTSIGNMIIRPGGKVLISGVLSGVTGVFGFNENGTPDAGFTTVPTGGSDMAVQADGKIIIVGGFNTFNGFPIPAGVLRVNTDGTHDASFNQGGLGASSAVRAVAVSATGKIVIGGFFLEYNGTPRNKIAVLNSDGTLDGGFVYTETSLPQVYDVLFQSDGKVIVSEYIARRLNPNGSIDQTLNTKLSTQGHANRVLVQPDGKILVAGDFDLANGEYRSDLARFNPDGTLDPTFNPDFEIGGTNQRILDLDIQADGKILAAGNVKIRGGDEKIAVRLNTNGSIDLSYFGPFGDLPFIKALPSGKFMLNNSRYNADGTRDTGFNISLGFGYLLDAVAQPDGKIIIVGVFIEVNSQPRARVARLNDNGTVDTTFNPPGGANDTVRHVALQPDGKILIAGGFTGVNFDLSKKYLARLNSNGTLDTTFTAAVNSPVTAIKLQPDAKILTGEGGDVAFTQNIKRLNPNGSIDSTFNIGAGADGSVNGIDLQADGKVLIAGSFIRVNGHSAVSAARLLNNLPQQTPFDYDGDGKADVSVFRSSENKWYVFRSSDSAVTQQVFAVAGDIPVPADYDGDQKTDFGVYRPSTGAWWYISSLDNTQVTALWGGEAGDVPRPSDFDGDGRADFIVFRPFNNFWYRITPNGTVSNVQFGLSGDKPVSGDFDGDGKSDPAIFRPSTGDWWYRSSINGAQLAVHWGISTDIPAPADFDGDGKTDLAVYRPSTGVWYILNSSNGSYTIMSFGLSEDKPVPADYDGDGKADIAVFRPSTSVWYLMRSTSGFAAMQFGISTDVPTPNAFVP